MRARRVFPAQPIEIGHSHKAADERARERHARDHHRSGLSGGCRQAGDDRTKYQRNCCQSADTTGRDLHGRPHATWSGHGSDITHGRRGAVRYFA